MLDRCTYLSMWMPTVAAGNNERQCLLYKQTSFLCSVEFRPVADRLTVLSLVTGR